MHRALQKLVYAIVYAISVGAFLLAGAACGSSKPSVKYPDTHDGVPKASDIAYDAGCGDMPFPPGDRQLTDSSVAGDIAVCFVGGTYRFDRNSGNVAGTHITVVTFQDDSDRNTYIRDMHVGQSDGLALITGRQFVVEVGYEGTAQPSLASIARDVGGMVVS